LKITKKKKKRLHTTLIYILTNLQIKTIPSVPTKKGLFYYLITFNSFIRPSYFIFFLNWPSKYIECLTETFLYEIFFFTV